MLKEIPGEANESAAVPDPAATLLEPDSMAAIEQAIQEGRVSQGRDMLAQLLKRQPDQAAAHELLAALYLAEDDYSSAEHHASRALECGSRSRAVYEARFDACLGLGSVDLAIKSLELSSQQLGPDLASLKRGGHVLVTLGLFDAAVQVLRPAVVAFGDDVDLRYNLAYALHRDGRNDETILLLKQCVAVDQFNSPHYHGLLSYLLVQAHAFADAVELLRAAVARDPENAASRRALSGVLQQSGLLNEAVIEGLAATRLDPTVPEYWTHVGGIASQLGHKRHAIELFRRATQLAPSDPEMFFALAHYLMTDQRDGEALEAIAVCVKLAPTVPRFRDLRLTLMERSRFQSQQVVAQTGATARPLPRSRDTRPRDATPLSQERAPLGLKFRIQARVIWALTMREIRLRDAKSRFGIATVIVEPIMHILTLWAVMSVMVHGHPPLGEHWFFFYSTGIIPFLMVTHMAGHGMSGHRGHKHLLDVPIIKSEDILIAAALSELILSASVAVIIFTIFYITGICKSLNNISGIISGYMVLWVFGFGLMLLNYVAASCFEIWTRVWYSVQRTLYFVSGIFYMAQFMPGWVREIIVWNPLLVGIEWFRNGFFEQYQPPWLNKPWLVSVAFASLLIGLMLEHSFKRYMK